jgi:Prenyltransferase and squalene oxidase repeat
VEETFEGQPEFSVGTGCGRAAARAELVGWALGFADNCLSKCRERHFSIDTFPLSTVSGLPPEIARKSSAAYYMSHRSGAFLGAMSELCNTRIKSLPMLHSGCFSQGGDQVAAKLLLCCVSQTMLLCCIAKCGTPDKHSTTLSGEAFAGAEVFINKTARPLERALFVFYFTHGSRDAVIAELAKFQNNDGGFASCLESDTRWCGSSPLGAMKALRIFTDLGVPAAEPHVKAVVRYLLASFDDKHGMWHALPKEANKSPHASWWEVREDTGKCEVESPLFPTAALAGYLQNYAALLPPGFLKRITDSSLNYLAAAPVPMEMPDIESLIELVRLLPPGERTDAVHKLKSVLAVVVVQDPKQWKSYNVKPLTFIHSPQSLFYPGMEKAVAANLDYLISTQTPDGGWGLTWSWEDRNPGAWKVAQKEWRGVVSLENLQKLQAFHRIAQ